MSPALPLRKADAAVDPQFPGRWSPRAFTQARLTAEDILPLLEAAHWAPSAINIQPWRFVWALRDEAAFDAIATALNDGNRVWAPKAAALIVVASATHRPAPDGGAPLANTTHAFDTGAAWMSLALQAHLSGLAAHAMGGFDATRAAAAIGLPEGHVIHAIVALGQQGTPDLLPEALGAREKPSLRKPVAEIAGHGRFPG